VGALTKSAGRSQRIIEELKPMFPKIEVVEEVAEKPSENGGSASPKFWPKMMI
jgi:3'-phosphoadenosine 5'-phosphosulfate (PAPS) 3'-phosphatase